MTASANATSPLLEIAGLSKRFGGLTALDGVALQIAPKEIVGLIGPNGAGKTTLFNVLTGLYRPDAGTIRFAGRAMIDLRPHAVAALGIARTFQNIRLFANMSALENVMVGRHVRTRSGLIGAVLRGKKTRAEEMAIRQRAQELLHYVGIGAHADRPARHLPYGDQRRLEIARALATDPQLLALDEPAAGMNRGETEALQALMEKLRHDGMTLLLIEHDMRLVMRVCDRLTVLDYGRVIATGAPRAVQRDPAVIAAYLGGELHTGEGA